MSSTLKQPQIAGASDMIARSGNAATAGYQDLAKAYQDLATRNAERLGAALQALAAVKSPMEFIDMQKKLIADGIEAAVRDGSHIAKLTGSIFAAAFEPVREHLDAYDKTAKK